MGIYPAQVHQVRVRALSPRRGDKTLAAFAVSDSQRATVAHLKQNVLERRRFRSKIFGKNVRPSKDEPRPVPSFSDLCRASHVPRPFFFRRGRRESPRAATTKRFRGPVRLRNASRTSGFPFI